MGSACLRGGRRARLDREHRASRDPGTAGAAFRACRARGLDGILVVMVERAFDVSAGGGPDADVHRGGTRLRRACRRRRRVGPGARRGVCDNRDRRVQPGRPGASRHPSGRPAGRPARVSIGVRECPRGVVCDRARDRRRPRRGGSAARVGRRCGRVSRRCDRARRRARADEQHRQRRRGSRRGRSCTRICARAAVGVDRGRRRRGVARGCVHRDGVHRARCLVGPRRLLARRVARDLAPSCRRRRCRYLRPRLGGVRRCRPLRRRARRAQPLPGDAGGARCRRAAAHLHARAPVVGGLRSGRRSDSPRSPGR